MINSIVFVTAHKTKVTDFTRLRKLSFATMFLLIMRHSIKSLQIVLNEYTTKFNLLHRITASAYSQARRKLKYTAFLVLFEGITTMFYKESEYKTFRGFRLVAVDGSKTILPKNTEMVETFGETKIKNQSGDLGTYTSAMIECHYDVLNNMVLAASINHIDSYEVDLAVKRLDILQTGDLAIYDRGYASYEMLAQLISHKKNFIIRLPKSSFTEANKMFIDDSISSKIVNLEPTHQKRQKVKDLGLPDNIIVRFVQVILSTGEIEVLATSLLSDQYRSDDFKYIYGLRWGVETFFGKIKGRLSLENFTGKTVESVLQDFWSTIFLSNLESILTQDAQEKLNANISEEQLKRNVNRAVSFNTIKNAAFELFASPKYSKDKEALFTKLTELFMMKPCEKRKDRNTPRLKLSSHRSLHFQKRVRKQIF